MSLQRVARYDAGELGCGAELVAAVKERLAPLAPGDRLAVVVRDPAAKVDLPALAWLLGHRVAGERALPGGALEFDIEVLGKEVSR